MADTKQASQPAEGRTAGPLPDLELLTKGSDGKWHKVGALWKSAKVPFSGEVEQGEQVMRVIAVAPRPPKSAQKEGVEQERRQ